MSHITKIRNLPITKAVLDVVKETIDFACKTHDDATINLGWGNKVKNVRCVIGIPVLRHQDVKFAIDNKGEAHYDTYDSGGIDGQIAVDKFIQQCARAKVILDAQAVGYSEPTNEIIHDNGVMELEVEV